MRIRIVFVFVSLFTLGSLGIPNTAAAAPIDASAVPGLNDTDHIIVLDANGIKVPILELNVSAANDSIMAKVRAIGYGSGTLLVNSSWLRDALRSPSFVNFSFKMTVYNGSEWYGVSVPSLTEGIQVTIKDFVPQIDARLYTAGSSESIALERPMFVALTEIPHIETEELTGSNGNGTWTEQIPRPTNRVGISFKDANTSGQTVLLNRSWLGTLGVRNASFSHEDRKPIANASDDYHYYLYPSHFSILYAFANSEGFTKESNQVHSDVYWDSVNRNIYVLSDRQDPTGTNERLRSPAPVTYDQTTSFKLRATWKTSQQGNWQNAVPVFFMGAGNTRVDMANSVYVRYYSRDSNLGNPPYYYLRYHDGAGNLRRDYLVVGAANQQYEFLFSYDAYTRVMSFDMLDSFGDSVDSTTYTLAVGETFSLGKVGAAAWGTSYWAEPTIIAKTDNIFLEANMARNGDFEVDTNSDGIPDNWQPWIWSASCSGCMARSSTIAKFGTWSLRIQDSSGGSGYGLQTLRMSVNQAETYTGSSWVYVSSGGNQLCLEFWDSASGGNRKGVVCKSTTVQAQWEFVDVTMAAPAGSSYVDLLAYSPVSNVGTGYFDGAELRRSRSFWSVHVHTNHVPDASTWRTVLDHVTDLGITSVRIDLTWIGFEPNRDVTDWAYVDYWDRAVRAIRSRGVGIVAIIGIPFPQWAWNLLNGCPGIPPGCPPDREAFFVEWREFASFIASRYGQDVQYYQLANEENHPDHSWFAHEHQYGEPRAFREAYLGLIEGTGLTAATHKSRFKTIVNAYVDDYPGGNLWNTWFRDILSDPWGAEAIDVVAIDHYPGTWCCGSNYRDWAVLDTLSSIARDYGKEMAIMETGYSTYGPSSHTQTDQEAWVSQALDEVLSRRNVLGSSFPLNPLLIVSWYEFIDLCSTCGGFIVNAEKHFGILTYNEGTGAWGVKLAFDDLRYQVGRWA